MASWRDQWNNRPRSPQQLHEEQQRAALETLGLDSKAQASLSDIKARYKELAQRFHPDHQSGGTASERAAAEAEFKRISSAFTSLRQHLPAAGEFVAIDPFGGVPWHHHTRYPPWSFARGPPYAPSWLVSTMVFGTVAAVYSALLYDAANPIFGERRVDRLLERDAQAKQRRLAEQADDVARAQEDSRAAREHMEAQLAASLAARAQKGVAADGTVPKT